MTRLALTAAGAGLAPLEPPLAWFDDPKLAGPTALTVAKDGRVYGHCALWGTCHTGQAAACVTPPRSRSDYAHFHLGSITAAGGEQVHVGQVTLGTGHAPLSMGASAAAEHYDHTGSCVADVRVGEDAHGIWVAGAVRPDVTPERVRELSAAKLSGDWRSVKGRLELIGLLAVNVPGFPVPRTQARLPGAEALVASEDGGDRRLALVASGIPRAPRRRRRTVTLSADEQRKLNVLAARAGGIQALAALAERSTT